jgi:hypothetical protein
MKNLVLFLFLVLVGSPVKADSNRDCLPLEGRLYRVVETYRMPQGDMFRGYNLVSDLSAFGKKVSLVKLDLVVRASDHTTIDIYNDNVRLMDLVVTTGNLIYFSGVRQCERESEFSQEYKVNLLDIRLAVVKGKN